MILDMLFMRRHSGKTKKKKKGSGAGVTHSAVLKPVELITAVQPDDRMTGRPDGSTAGWADEWMV